MAYASTVRFSSEIKRLKSLMDHLAARISELLTLAATANATTEEFVQMPTSIGDSHYWLELRNDSRRAWLNGSLGDTPLDRSTLQISLPGEAEATGHYLSGHGAARLTCHASSGVTQIQLASSSEGK